MLNSAFELAEQMRLRQVEYIVHADIWEKFKITTFDLNFANWTSVKYLNDDATGFSDDITAIPNDKGGLYLFYVKCPILIGITEYPFYTGFSYKNFTILKFEKRC